jgi:hypothetical protein
MNHHPQYRASAADLPPELLWRRGEVEQLLRESGNPEPDEPDLGGTEPRNPKITETDNVWVKVDHAYTAV